MNEPSACSYAVRYQVTNLHHYQMLNLCKVQLQDPGPYNL
jgi:hypothetical protein